jgi:uncharacterized damage-inducible protein DinB
MMNERYLARIFEHNNWANQQIIQICLTLTDEQLDAEPTSATYGSIRKTLLHMVSSQKGYLQQLILPVEERRKRIPLTFAEVLESVTQSGEALLALARGEINLYSETNVQSADGYAIEPWVLILQIVNHADEHREQIKSMLTALGIKPPRTDGWGYGESTGALVKIEGA